MEDLVKRKQSPSSIDTLMTCPKKYQHIYERGYREKGHNHLNLNIGSMVHLGLNAYWHGKGYIDAEQQMDEAADKSEWWAAHPSEMVKCLSYVYGYYERYDQAEEFKKSSVLGVEWEFSNEFKGFIDALVVRDGRITIIDHKTATARSAGSWNPAYWDKLSMVPQTVIYQETVRAYYNLDYIPPFEYDVVIKSTNKPTKKDGGLQGFHDRMNALRVDNWSSLYLRETYETTPKEHEVRLNEIKNIIKLAETQELGYTNTRNTGSCGSYGARCPFMDVCLGRETLESSPNLINVGINPTRA